MKLFKIIGEMLMLTVYNILNFKKAILSGYNFF